MIVGSDVKLDPMECPNCKHMLDGAFSVGSEATPENGDASICIECGHLVIFDNNQLRNPTDAEIIEFAGDPRIVAAMTALDKIRKAKP